MIPWLGRLLFSCVMAVIGSVLAFYAVGFFVGPLLLMAKPFIPDDMVDPMFTLFRGSLGWISIVWGLICFWLAFRFKN